MNTTGFCWLSYPEQKQLRKLVKYAVEHDWIIADNSNDSLRARITELELDSERLRAEIETLQRMRHASLKGEKS